MKKICIAFLFSLYLLIGITIAITTVAMPPKTIIPAIQFKVKARMYERAPYTGPTPLAGVKLTVFDPSKPSKIAEKITLSSPDTEKGCQYFKLLKGSRCDIFAQKDGYTPTSYQAVDVKKADFPGAEADLFLNLYQMNPFTSDMLTSARPIKIIACEQGGSFPYLTGVKIFIYRKVGDYYYGIITNTLSSGQTPDLSIPYATDYQVTAIKTGYEPVQYDPRYFTTSTMFNTTSGFQVLLHKLI